jgi:formylglycine-generating enzyme required for sulfatase activity
MSSTPPTSPDPNRPPRPAPGVPDYQLERLIGRGSYGEVWLARTALGARRAVKVVYRDSFDSERPYLREFAGIRAYEPISSHESQVSVFHVGKNDEAGYFYYVMELADDAATLTKPFPPLPATEPAASPPAYEPATLGVLLKQRGRLPCAEALPLARSLASALDRLHGHGLVHRDIKPANIIFVDGRPKLADIGLVTSAAKADTLVGTTGYIPPEGPGTAAADLFSFGKVLYEVVTGHDRQEFPMLPDDLAQLPDREQLLEVNEIILKCCHLDPRERYASGADVLADLKRIEAGHSLRRDRARRRQLAVAAVVVLAAVAVWGWDKFRPVPVAAPVRPTQMARAKPAEPEGRWTNSLGMVFTSLPGLPVQFSIWETRVQDYEQFARATSRSATTARSSVRGRTNLVSWLNPADMKPAPDHPVRLVTWDDANDFCVWLTERERAAGWLREGETYRLPTDLEWSWAIGLTNETGSTPVERHSDGSQTNVFYWGTNWPPPDGAGNFSDENSVMFQHIAGYLDPFPGIAPVGSFPAERHGLFDLAGNVAEWCGDELVERAKGGSPVRVSRGAAYENSGQSAFRITRRMMTRAEIPSSAIGFRVVRVALPGPPPTPPVAVAVAAPVPEPPAAPAQRPTAVHSVTRTNSLGMVFVPVAGLTAEFSIWETRVRDFRVFAEATKHQTDVGTFQEATTGNKRIVVERRWHEEALAANPDWPVRAISPRDALAFCAWLTAHERAAGLLPTNLCYRLPRDHEWSWAAGLTNEVGATSLERFRSATGPPRYPWGTNWPPPLGAGNFSGRESVLSGRFQIPGYRDDFATVGPVGSFPAEANGLFDLAGNVSEICEEWPPVPGVEPRFPRRGASFDRYEPEDLEMRARRSVSLKHSSVHAGFRVVRAPVEDNRPPGK